MIGTYLRDKRENMAPAAGLRNNGDNLRSSTGRTHLGLTLLGSQESGLRRHRDLQGRDLVPMSKPHDSTPPQSGYREHRRRERWLQ